MSFNKAVTKPPSMDVFKERLYNPIFTGLDVYTFYIDTEITFYMLNKDVKIMLTKKLVPFKKLVKLHRSSVDIDKTRNKWRRITIIGDEASSLYRDLRSL